MKFLTSPRGHTLESPSSSPNLTLGIIDTEATKVVCDCLYENRESHSAEADDFDGFFLSQKRGANKNTHELPAKMIQHGHICWGFMGFKFWDMQMYTHFLFHFGFWLNILPRIVRKLQTDLSWGNLRQFMMYLDRGAYKRYHLQNKWWLAMILGLSLLLGDNAESPNRWWKLEEILSRHIGQQKRNRNILMNISSKFMVSQLYKKMILNFQRLVCCQGVFLGNDDNHLICYHNHIIWPAFHLSGWKALQQLLLRLLSIEGSVLLASAELRRPFLNAFVEELFEVSWLGSILRWWYLWSSYLYVFNMYPLILVGHWWIDMMDLDDRPRDAGS